jgi:hypothetical protein
MSGPKVVRVVTREELVSQCEGALTRLDRCLELWRLELGQMGQLTDANKKGADDRRQRLEAAIREDRFADVLAQAAAEVGYLEADVDAQRQKHAEARAQEAGRRESARKIAREVAHLLAKSGTADVELVAELEGVGTGQCTVAEADALLARAFIAMSSKSVVGLSESQKALAQRLSSGASDESLQAWKARHAPRDERLEAVHRLIADVRSLDEQTPLKYEALLADLLTLDESPSRRLRIDSLALDLAAARTALQRLTRLRRDAEMLCAELDAEGQAELEKSAERLMASWNDAIQLEVAIVEEGGALEAARKRRAADARRAAVLKGLASLGYSVSEGMSTALAGNGRLVLQKPDMPGYGVELAGGEHAERLQVRVVALARSRDTTKDVAAETKWCSDFGDLREALAAFGTQIVTEQALPVGKVPLRVVVSEAAESEERGRGAIGTQQRSTPGSSR